MTKQTTGDIQVGRPAIPSGPGKQHVPTELPLLTILGTFTEPRTGQITPLPPHCWALPASTTPSAATIYGHWSDTHGISMIPRPLRQVSVSPSRALVLVPLPGKPRVAQDMTPVETAAFIQEARVFYDRYAAQGEAWIDLDALTWVLDVTRFQLEKRRLLRIPYWNSTDKAQTGGFLTAPPGSAFAKDGLIDLSTIRPHGKASSPWEIRVDHNWFGVHLQLRYYDALGKVARVVPPGLVIDAQDETRSGEILGSGVHIGDDIAYILHARTRSQVQKRVNYNFRTDDFPFIDLTVAPSLEVAPLGTFAQDFDSIRGRYLLPNEWNTLGMEVIQGERQQWRVLRKTSWAASREQPLVFHLDDAILVDQRATDVNVDDEFKPMFGPFGRVCSILDHRFAVRDPSKPSPQLWKGTLERNYLRAEEMYYVDGKGFDETTLLIYLAGKFYELGEDRALADVTFVCTGLRIARQIELTRSSSDGPRSLFYYHLFVDAMALASTVAATGRQLLSHLLIHIPYFENEGFNIDVIAAAAAQRWTQQHPGDPSSSGLRNYIIAPVVETSTAPQIVKLIHFFAPGRPGIGSLRMRNSERGSGSFVGTLVADQSLALFYDRDDELADLSFVAPKRLVHGTAVDPDHLPKHIEGAIPDGDMAPLKSFALAHELGHVLGLPDEYLVPILHAGAKRDIGKDMVPSFSVEQDGEARPFVADRSGLMNGAYYPRLRYFWNKAGIVNEILGSAAPVPFVPAYLSNPARELRYDLPDLADMNTRPPSRISPWTAILTGKVPVPAKNTPRPCVWSLFALGDDEWRDRAGFRSFDGIITIETYYWFNFLTNNGVDFPSDAERWNVIKGFNDLFFTSDGAPRVKFFVDSSSPAANPLLPRLAILFQPRFEFGPDPMITELVNGSGTALNTADFISTVLAPMTHMIVDVVWEAPGLTDPPNDLLALTDEAKALSKLRSETAVSTFSTDAPSVSLGMSSVGFALQRLALGRPPATSSFGFGTKVNHTLAADDLAWLAVLLSQMLDGTNDSRVIKLV